MITKFKNKKGITLVETMVAISIMLLLNGALSVFIIKSFEINRYTIEQGLNTSVIQNSLYSVTKYLREARQSDAGGYLIESADDYDLVFYSNIDEDVATEKVHLYLQNGMLMMGSSEASGFPLEYPVGDQESKIMGGYIYNSGTEPMFSYYNKDYPVDIVNNPLVSPIAIEKINLIRVNIFANIDPEHIPNRTQIETFVRPRNIDYD